MLCQLLLRCVLLLIPIIVKLMMITFVPTLTSLAIYSLTTCAAIDYTGWMWLHVGSNTWVQKFWILCLLRVKLSSSWCMINRWAAPYICHLLIIHWKVFLIEILHTWLMILRPYYLLDSSWKWTLRTPLWFCINGLMMLWKLWRLWLISCTSLILLVSLMVVRNHVLLRCCRFLM